MKKTLLLIILPLFFMGCSNFLDNETNISINANVHQSRADLNDTYNVKKIEVWITEPGVDYRLEDPDNFTYIDDVTDIDLSDVTDIDLSDVTDIDLSDVTDIDLSDVTDSFILYKQVDNSNSVELTVQTDVVKVFSLRVVFESTDLTKPDRVFMGYKQRAISQFTDSIPIDIYETETSKQIVYWSELNEYLNSSDF